jgi:hypothetical protein
MTKMIQSRRNFILAGIGLAITTMVPQFSRAALFLPASIRHSRHRVVVSTDIGGTDPDDFQSMVHLLVSADRIELEGLISSPFGSGRKRDILDVIDIYAQDYPNLSRQSADYPYPSPAFLKQITQQGAIPSMGYPGFGKRSEGSDWIIRCARKPDPRPLHLLIWGGIDDLAQALHDAPDILPKLRVYSIAGPNKKWSANAYQYIADNHPTLWIIEANSTYRGWFVGGDQNGDLDNTRFVTEHVADYGALGRYFATQLSGTIKMGDAPSLAWVLNNDTSNPASPGWGGQFVRAWERPHAIFERLTDAEDRVEQFAVVEFRLPIQTNGSKTTAILKFENQCLNGYWNGNAMCFRCCPKKATLNEYSIESSSAELDGKQGSFTSYPPPIERLNEPSPHYPNWWTDNPDPQWAEGEHQGAVTVNMWRPAFLNDFAKSMFRCANHASLP